MTSENIKKKIKDRAGVSLALALVLMLITTSVSAVVLTAAMTSVKRSKSRVDTEQSLLTLQSALVLVRDEFTDKTFTVKAKTVNGIPSGENPTVTVDTDCALLPAIEDCMLYAVTYNTTQMQTAPQVFTVTGAFREKTLDPVTITMTMCGVNKSDYKAVDNFRINLSAKVEGKEEQLDLVLFTRFLEKPTQSKIDSNTVEITYKFQWYTEWEE